MFVADDVAVGDVAADDAAFAVEGAAPGVAEALLACAVATGVAAGVEATGVAVVDVVGVANGVAVFDGFASSVRATTAAGVAATVGAAAGVTVVGVPWYVGVGAGVEASAWGVAAGAATGVSRGARPLCAAGEAEFDDEFAEGADVVAVDPPFVEETGAEEAGGVARSSPRALTAAAAGAPDGLRPETTNVDAPCGVPDDSWTTAGASLFGLRAGTTVEVAAAAVDEGCDARFVGVGFRSVCVEDAAAVRCTPGVAACP